MASESIPQVTPRFMLLRMTVLLLMLGGLVFLFFFFRCIDGCGPYYNSTSVADLDGDGDLDVVLANVRHETDTIIWTGLTFWINQGGEKFTARRVEIGGPSAAAGDLDGDGDADLFKIGMGEANLYTNQGGTQGRQPGEVLINRTIRPGDDLIYPGGYSPVVLGDLNQDGRLDAFVGSCCGATLTHDNGKQQYFQSMPWVWLNLLDNKGRLLDKVVSQSVLGDLPMHPALGDLDGDGDLDVYAAVQPSRGSAEITIADRVLLNDGSGTFTDSGQRLAHRGVNGGSTAAALGDLDGDGDLDALVGRTDGALVWTNLGGAQGGQPGVFGGSGENFSRDPGYNVFLADFDGDGDLDALLASITRAALWWNDGPRGFRDSGQRLRYNEQHGLAVADFNADGRPDVFTAAYDAQYHLWLNQGTGILSPVQ